MASENQYSELIQVANNFIAIDKSRIIREELGVESLKGIIEPILDEIDKRIKFVIEYGRDVPDSPLSQVRQLIHSINEHLILLARSSNNDYISNKSNILDAIGNYIEAIKGQWIYFVSSAIEKSELLENKDVNRTLEILRSEISRNTEDSLKRIEEESHRAINNAKELAHEIEIQARHIENNARNTAKGISVQVAQDQFEKLQGPLKLQLKIWGSLSAICLISIFVLIYIYLNENLPDEWSWKIAYKSAIHITSLATFGSIAAYCLGLFRSHMHMLQHNKHRCTLANSMVTLVDAASTPEQRDIILIHLVTAISDFGNTGLIGNKDSENPKLSIGSISPSIASQK
ncbi:hypothetical protein LG204_14020 [Methylovorus menthalis]|uniref:hypothetical protein n=1 Tax=Methylovorus menthalis TaxID=1002227 RepID=UPI001E38238D|nr:hypothetical protein [Methylovorus menthalis]MCB4812430.1 hypothetical protein [Methylovorus menthalis]